MSENLIAKLFVHCVVNVHDTYGNAYVTENFGEDVINEIQEMIKRLGKDKTFQILNIEVRKLEYEEKLFFNNDLNSFISQYVKDNKEVKEVLEMCSLPADWDK